MQKVKTTKILGIDPGLAAIGFGLITKNGDKNVLVDYGVIKTRPTESFSERLAQVHVELTKLINKSKPDVIGVEELFFYKNVKTATDVGQVRGVIILTAIQQKLRIREFTPLQVKQAVTGYGLADKRQVQKMVKLLLNMPKLPRPDDAADALAVALSASQTIDIN